MAWSEEAKQRVRRRKAARRTWKKAPVFAFQMLCEQFPGYTTEMFLEDLKPRRQKPKRLKVKNHMRKYGRFAELQTLTFQWDDGDRTPELGLRILQLEKNLKKPFRLLKKFEGKLWEFYYTAKAPVSVIKELAALANDCKTKEEFEERAKPIQERLDELH